MSLGFYFTAFRHKKSQPDPVGSRAENGAQTRDPQLGRLVLYQLSYFRVSFFFCVAKVVILSFPTKFSLIFFLFSPKQGFPIQINPHNQPKRANLPPDSSMELQVGSFRHF